MPGDRESVVSVQKSETVGLVFRKSEIARQHRRVQGLHGGLRQLVPDAGPAAQGPRPVRDRVDAAQQQPVDGRPGRDPDVRRDVSLPTRRPVLAGPVAQPVDGRVRPTARVPQPPDAVHAPQPVGEPVHGPDAEPVARVTVADHAGEPVVGRPRVPVRGHLPHAPVGQPGLCVRDGRGKAPATARVRTTCRQEEL